MGDCSSKGTQEGWLVQKKKKYACVEIVAFENLARSNDNEF